ncbi:hypothetical protein SDC9_93347 [bioreactor metagenome]|uniref:Uncharacterized protein n=1 Tax=bioreactor metagenome TaxID=1076179 RepID=A0A645A0S2_9ZZZZ
MKFSPRKRMPKPRSTSAPSRVLLFLLNIIGAAKAIETRAKMVISTLKPKRATIHPVKVVPMFAPRITPMAWVRPISPAFTKLTTMTVVAEELWMMMVMSMPVMMETNRFLVINLRMAFILSPADFCKPSLRSLIPNKKRPRLPTIWKKIIMVFISAQT